MSMILANKVNCCLKHCLMVSEIDYLNKIWSNYNIQQLSQAGCKRVKIFNCSSEIIFGQLLWTFGDFFLVTLVGGRFIVTKGRFRIPVPSGNLLMHQSRAWLRANWTICTEKVEKVSFRDYRIGWAKCWPTWYHQIEKMVILVWPIWQFSCAIAGHW